MHSLLAQIQLAIHNRKEFCYVTHIQAHTNLPGPLSKANALVDAATHLCLLTSNVEQA